MMSQTNVNFRMDAELKREMEALCHELGITMTAAFTIFARKMTREQRIPFDVSLERPRAETLAAMKEADDIAANPEKYKGYDDVDEMIEDILNEEACGAAEALPDDRLPA